MTTNQNFKPSEGKREEFRKYLEKNGIMDALTKVLVNLYEEVEKPENALQYILDKLAVQAGFETQLQLNTKLDEANARIKSLEEELEQLKVVEEPPPEASEIPEDVDAVIPEAPPADVEEVAPEPVPQDE